MAVDDGPSRRADIAERMDANYASQYRRRLIAADLIYRISMRWLGGRCKNTSWERRTRSIPTQARPVTE